MRTPATPTASLACRRPSLATRPCAARRPAQPTSLVGQAKTTRRDGRATRSGTARRTSRSTRSGLIGVSYRFGGETPEDGLDCSGLVRHVFQQVTGVTLPRTAKEMSRDRRRRCARTDLAPGDLVFFNTRRFAFSHVGHLRRRQPLHPRAAHGPRRRDRRVSTAATGSKRFDGARRLVGVVPALVPTLIASAIADAAGLPTRPPTPATSRLATSARRRASTARPARCRPSAPPSRAPSRRSRCGR